MTNEKVPVVQKLILLNELIVSAGGNRVKYGRISPIQINSLWHAACFCIAINPPLMKKTIVFALVMQLVIYLLIFLIA